MIICEKCFCDVEIISKIRNKGWLGNCSLCNNKNVYVYDTDRDDELTMMFEELISIYTPVSLLPKSFPRSETKLLKNELLNNWRIFNNKTETEVYRFMVSVCKDKYCENHELFDYPVGIVELYDKEYLSEHSLLTTNSWDDFVDALIRKNRFHTHFINSDLFRRFCTYIRRSYKVGDIFWRSRISNEDGIPIIDMGAPPFEKTINGRANARGIRCLYLSDSIETTIYETRAGVYDYLTIGKFRLKKDIIVVDFKMIDHISPFIEGLDCLEYAINREHLNRINSEMGRVMRRSDSPLEYVPTQYITDLIKSFEHDDEVEYSGIEYKSVMYNDGYNLAVFEPELFECIDTVMYRIDTIDYRKHVI